MSDLRELTRAEACIHAANAERRAAAAESAKARKEWRLIARQWQSIIDKLERKSPPKPRLRTRANT
jgi:hypothetical protein